MRLRCNMQSTIWFAVGHLACATSQHILLLTHCANWSWFISCLLDFWNALNKGTGSSLQALVTLPSLFRKSFWRYTWADICVLLWFAGGQLRPNLLPCLQLPVPQWLRRGWGTSGAGIQLATHPAVLQVWWTFSALYIIVGGAVPLRHCSRTC